MMLPAARASLLFSIAAAVSIYGRQFRLPKHPPAELYGKILIQRGTANGAAKAVGFSHATHRIRYTCRVCHLELDFAFKTNATEITEEANRKGLYCGACHNGTIAFGHVEPNCVRCHTGTIETGPENLAASDALPWSRFGNGVDWSRAIASGAIHPAASLAAGFRPMTLDRTLTLEAEWNFVPPAIFGHPEHVRWLDCANCHPSIFNVKKKTTQHFSMTYNLQGQFCGVCHLRVAFPLDDCLRCHPTMKDNPVQ